MKYAEISLWIDGKKQGSYAQELGSLMEALDGELDGWDQENAERGTELRVCVIEMQPNDFEKLGEFEGW